MLILSIVVVALVISALLLPPILGRGRWGYFTPSRSRLEVGAYRGGTVPHYPLKPVPRTVRFGIVVQVIWALVTVVVFVPAGLALLLVVGDSWFSFARYPDLDEVFVSTLSLVASHVMFGLCLSGVLLSLASLLAAVQLARRNERWERPCVWLYHWSLAHHGAATVVVFILSAFFPPLLLFLMGPFLGTLAAMWWRSAVQLSFSPASEASEPFEAPSLDSI